MHVGPARKAAVPPQILQLLANLSINEETAWFVDMSQGGVTPPKAPETTPPPTTTTWNKILWYAGGIFSCGEHAASCLSWRAHTVLIDLVAVGLNHDPKMVEQDC